VTDSAALAQVLWSQEQPFSLAHFNTPRCRYFAASAQVLLFQEQPFSLAHINPSRFYEKQNWCKSCGPTSSHSLLPTSQFQCAYWRQHGYKFSSDHWHPFALQPLVPILRARKAIP